MSDVPSAVLKILVVDDHVDNADALAMLLEVFGHEVKSCFDGQAAVELAREWAPDLILMDLSLPILDGYAAAYQISTHLHPGRKRPLMVALSGHSGEAEMARSLQAGFAKHLVKPIAADTLQAVTEQALAYRSGAA